MSLTYFTARSTLVTYAFLWEKVKTVDFSETIAACDLKVGRCRQRIEIMKVEGRDLHKLKSVKCIPSLSKVKEIIHKHTKIRFCSSHFLYINQRKTQV